MGPRPIAGTDPGLGTGIARPTSGTPSRDALEAGVGSAPVDPLPRACPACSSAGSVLSHFCQVCYEELVDGAEDRGAAGLPPAAPLRFSDVIEELRRAATLADVADPRGPLAAACRRVEALIEALRAQFLGEILAVGPRPDTGQASGREVVTTA